MRIIPIAVSTGPTAPPAAPTALRTYLVPITAVRAYLLLYIPMYVLQNNPGIRKMYSGGDNVPCPEKAPSMQMETPNRGYEKQSPGGEHLQNLGPVSYTHLTLPTILLV